MQDTEDTKNICTYPVTLDNVGDNTRDSKEIARAFDFSKIVRKYNLLLIKIIMSNIS